MFTKQFAFPLTNQLIWICSSFFFLLRLLYPEFI